MLGNRWPYSSPMTYFQRKYIGVWLSLARIPLGLVVYGLAIYLAPQDSWLAYYLFLNLFAFPFVLVVTTFWDSFEAARVWAKFFIGIQPFLLLSFWPTWTTLVLILFVGILVSFIYRWGRRDT